MKDNYKMNVSLQCITCGGQEFDFNDDKTYIKCRICNHEYLNGYDELVALNQENIDMALASKKAEIEKDIKQEILKAFKGSKNIKIR